MSSNKKSMVIGGGIYKGMKIAAPDGQNTRPTRSIARLSAINSMQMLLPGARLLDLYAGTGAVGLEAISRGAEGCYFVENAPDALRAIETNIKAMLLRAHKQNIAAPDLRVIRSTVEDCWSLLPKNTQFDIVWADPPYQDAGTALQVICTHAAAFLAKEGCIFLESDDKLPISEHLLPGWRHEKTKKFGITCLHKITQEPDSAR